MNTKHDRKIVESNCDAKVMKRTAKVLEKIKYNLKKKKRKGISYKYLI